MTTPARPSSSGSNLHLQHSSTSTTSTTTADLTNSAAPVSARDPPSPTRSDNPRPSISPLSAKASPIALREHISQSDQVAREDGPDRQLHNDDDKDDGSSVLSEPDDDPDVEAPQSRPDDVLESPEEFSAHQSLEVDSEAETERLDQTPHKVQKQFEDNGRTPSKLSQAAAPEDELSDPPSPLPTGQGAASSTSTTDTLGKKRKRSDTADSSLSSADSELAESPRKRSHSAPTNNAPTHIAADGESTVGGEAQVATNKAAVVSGPEQPEAATSPTKGNAKAKRGPKPKGKGKKDTTKDVGAEKVENLVQTEEQSAEAMAKAAEEVKHKPAAAVAFEELAKQFSAFREKMISEKLAATNAELDLLNQPNSRHPEYLRQIACVDVRKAKQVSEAHAFYKFKLESLRRTTLGERSQLHSQYFQHARQLREDVMQQLGDDWYKIQNERRQSNQEEDENYIYKFPTKKSDQIKQQAKYNQEVSVLSGVAKYVGFPAAPDITGADRDMLDDDLKAMKIPKRAQQPASHAHPVYFPNRTSLVQPQSERIAHEQFVEQNPWARPQGTTIHNHLTPNIAHTPDWADGAKQLPRSLGVTNGHQQRVSPYATPMPQRHALFEHSSTATVPANSDPADLPSSGLAAVPIADGAMQVQSEKDVASPLYVAKQRQNGDQLTGVRNISNISGASTIDAPGSAEKEQGTTFLSSAAKGHHPFDTSQLQRQVNEVRRQHEQQPYVSSGL